MSGEFEKKLDLESERDRRSRSDSGSDAPGVPPEPAPREGEGLCGELVKDFDLSSVDHEDRAEGWHPGLYLPENIPLSRFGRPRGRGFKKPPLRRPSITSEQRLLILDTWKRSGLSGTDFASLVGITAVTLYHWKKRFEAEGPGGILDRPKGRAKASRLPDLTRRTILMLGAEVRQRLGLHL